MNGIQRIVAYLCSGNDVYDGGTDGSGDIQIPQFVFGGKGHDKIIGGNAGDVLAGGEGDDLLYGRGGRDILIGGDGKDKLSVVT